jgi:hypothetical protein
MPAAYQENAPFGANVGGVNPAFLSAKPTAAYDSYLTVGKTEGDAAGEISSIGIDWDSWTISAGLSVDNGAAFWMTPDDGPTGSAVVAQITVAGPWDAKLSVQGRSTSGDDYQAVGITYTSAGAVAGGAVSGGDSGGDDVCVDYYSENNQNYDQILDQPLSSSKAITFSVKASNDAHIGFFSAAGSTSEVYEIVLSGWGNTQSVIRQSNQGSNEVIQATPDLLDGDAYLPFWADAVSGLVRVGSGSSIGNADSIIMQWQDPEHHEATNIGLMTGWGSDGYVFIGWLSALS